MHPNSVVAGSTEKKKGGKEEEVLKKEVFPWITSLANTDKKFARQAELINNSDIQVMLEARVLVVGFNAVGVEVVKNLMLLGFGNIDLLDNEVVSWMDVSCSHVFLESDMEEKNFDSEKGSLRTSNRVLDRLRKINKDCSLKAISSLDEVEENNSASEKKPEYDFIVCCNQIDRNVIEKASKLRPDRFMDVQVRGLTGRFFSSYPYFRKDWDEKLPKYGTYRKFTEECVFEKRDRDDWTSPNTLERRFIGTETDDMDFDDDDDDSDSDSESDSSDDEVVEIEEEEDTTPPLPIDTFHESCGPLQYHVSYFALHHFFEKFKRLPRAYDNKDADEFLKLVENSAPVKNDIFANKNDVERVKMKKKAKKEWVRRHDFFDEYEQRLFSFTCAATVGPMCSMFGGLVGNEIMKIVVGDAQESSPPRVQERKLKKKKIVDGDFVLMEPDETMLEKKSPKKKKKYLSQTAIPCCYYSGRRYIPEILPDVKDCEPKTGQMKKYMGQVRIFGSKWQEFAMQQRIFLVGAGALSSETMKLLAIIGAKRIIVTDMDRIETSNLNRQFFFQDKDAMLKRLKSEVICEKMLDLNSDIGLVDKNDAYETSGKSMELFAHSEMVQNMDVFSDRFFKEDLDAIILGLDNPKARNYCHEKGVLFHLPVFDSGINGFEGNTWVYSPGETDEVIHGEVEEEEGMPQAQSCTIKNNPQTMDHLVQYANYKFKEVFMYDTAKIRAMAKRVVGGEDPGDTALKYVRYFIEDVDDALWFSRWLWEELFVSKPTDEEKWKIYTRKIEFDEDEKNEDGFECKMFMKTAFLLTCHCFNVDWKCKLSKLKAIFSKGGSVEKAVKKLIPPKIIDEEVLKHHAKTLCRVLSVGKFDKDEQTHVHFLRSVSNLRRKVFDLNFRGVKLAKDLEIKKMVGKMIASIITPVSVLQGVVLLNYFNFINNKLGRNGRTRRNYCRRDLNLKFFYFAPGVPHLVCNWKHYEPRPVIKSSEASSTFELLQSVMKFREDAIPLKELVEKDRKHILKKLKEKEAEEEKEGGEKKKKKRVVLRPGVQIQLTFGMHSKFSLFSGKVGENGTLVREMRTPMRNFKMNVLEKLKIMHADSERDREEISKMVPKSEEEFKKMALMKKMAFDFDVTKAEKFILRFEWPKYPYGRTKNKYDEEGNVIETKSVPDKTLERFEFIYVLDEN